MGGDTVSGVNDIHINNSLLGNFDAILINGSQNFTYNSWIPSGSINWGSINWGQLIGVN